MMKKLFLFLTVLTFGITMSSCLNGGGQVRTEPAVVYIQTHQDTFEKYGRTNSGFQITNQKIQSFEDGSFKYLFYSWDEDKDGYSTSGDNVVQIMSEVKDIDKKNLSITDETPEPLNYFTMIESPLYNSKGYWFDDYWVFQYQYSGKEGQEPSVSFFMKDNELGDNNTLKIDIRLDFVGEPEDGAEPKSLYDFVVLDMSYIRSKYLDLQGEDKINVELYYHDKENDEAKLVRYGEKSQWSMEKSEKE